MRNYENGNHAGIFSTLKILSRIIVRIRCLPFFMKHVGVVNKSRKERENRMMALEKIIFLIPMRETSQSYRQEPN